MAIKYLRSSASGSANGTTMANAYTTIGALITAGISAGDTILVASDHSEAQGSQINMTFTTSHSSPNMMISVDPITENFSAGAFISTTGNFDIFVLNNVIMDGVNLSVGVGATTARSIGICRSSGVAQIIRNSTMTMPNVANSRALVGNNFGGLCTLDNVTFAISAATSYCRMDGRVLWKNSTPYSGTAPTYLLDNSTNGTNLTLDGCDVSTCLSGKTVRQTLASTGAVVRFVNCKFPSSITMFSGLTQRGDLITIVNCSIASGFTMDEVHDYTGSSTLSDTIYRTSGASDGTTSFSNKIAASANASRYWPCFGIWLNFNVTAAMVGVSKTLTAYLLSVDQTGTPTGVTLAATEAWIEIEYLADSTSLDSATTSSGPANSKAAGTAPSADASSTWTSTGLTTPVKQTVAKSFTPLKAGLHRARIALAKASTTTYVDPKMVLS